MSTPAVEIIGVHKQFGQTAALDRIDFSVGDGEFVSLLGASGCGKSTLLRIIAGFEQPTKGVVRVYGNDITRQPPEKRPTNLVFQRGALFPHMTVSENIGYSLKLKGFNRQRIDARVAELLALVRLEGFGKRAPNQLSGGQSQRVALARALAGEPRVLLLDEPLSALDLKLRQQMQIELRAIQRQLKATFVFVTHDQTEALVMSDRIAIMNHGRIVQYGTPREVYCRPNSVFVSDFVGATNLFRGSIVAIDADRVLLQTDCGVFSAPKREFVTQTGARATLSIRPEAMHLERGNAQMQQSSVSGTLSEVIYQGNNIRAGVRLATGAIVWAEARDQEFEALTPGDAVTLSWDESAATILGDSSE